MDKNQVIGFTLIALMVIMYMQFFNEAPPVQDIPESDTTVQVTPQETVPSTTQEQPQFEASGSDSVVNAQMEARLGVFASLGSGKVETVSLENDLVKIDINTLGGIINYVELKNFQSSYGDPLSLIEKNRSQINWKFTDFQNRNINLSQLFYKVKDFNKSSNKLVLSGVISSSQSIEITYELPEDSYVLSSSIKFVGLETFISNEVKFEWTERIKHHEHDVEVSRNNAAANYYTVSGDFEETSNRSLDLEEEAADEPVKWFSFTQKFFVSAIIADSSFQNGKVSAFADISDSTTVKTAHMTGNIPSQSFFKPEGAVFDYYFGPKEYEVLGTITDGFSENLYLGWPPVNLVNKWVLIPLFNLLSSFISNYGIIIIIMVILIKLVLSPLSYKSYLSMAKMKVLKPQLDELKEQNEKDGGDMAKLQQDQLALYRQVGVNPVSGCIPMVLQMPILFAMFYFFPQSIHLRQQSFLWANDLSSYDVIAQLPFTIPGYGSHVSLFVLLMTVSTILYTWSNNQMSSVTGPMKSVSYIMPVILLFVLNSFPAALSFYYFVSNLVTFGQQAIIRRFVNEDKIKAILEENKKRNVNKKKSKFVVKLEEAIKASEQNQRNKKK